MALINCPKCNKAVNSKEKICPYCGIQLKASFFDNAKKKASQLTNKTKKSKNYQTAKEFSEKQFADMKNEFKEGGIKKLIKNKAFIALSVIGILFIIFIFSGDDESTSTSVSPSVSPSSEDNKTNNTDELARLNNVKKLYKKVIDEFNESMGEERSQQINQSIMDGAKTGDYILSAYCAQYLMLIFQDMARCSDFDSQYKARTEKANYYRGLRNEMIGYCQAKQEVVNALNDSQNYYFNTKTRMMHAPKACREKLKK